MSSIKGCHNSGEIEYFSILPCGRIIKQTQSPDLLLKFHARKCVYCKNKKIDKVSAKYREGSKSVEDPRFPVYFNLLYDKA